ncbi:MAG: prepilin peptidase, partial [bacterium]|nr:prepilin peptidase [bacterium]
MFAVIFGLFGLIIGSFLNVLIVRGGVRALSGRSACMSCGRGIPWYDLIPVFSWVLLRGRCRFCRSKISVQYPLVELTTALLFAALGASPVSLIARIFGLLIVA